MISPTKAAVILALAALTLTHLMAYTWGRSDEAETAIAAYTEARRAQIIADELAYRLSETLGVSERAVRVCLMTDAGLHSLHSDIREWRGARVVVGR